MGTGRAGWILNSGSVGGFPEEMKYTVTWKPRVKEELARIWMEATDRTAVTAAADAIDERLSTFHACSLLRRWP